MTRFSQLSRHIIIIILILLCSQSWGFPTNDGDRSKYDFSIDIGKAYLSGILVLMNDGENIKGSLVNEFGISAIDFVSNGKKVEIITIMKKMDKWYIRKLLKKDLVRVLDAMKEGLSEYRNPKHKIEYRFKELA